MESQKCARYSKCLDAEEIEEILMEEESGNELEELNEFFEPRENISSSINEADKVEIGFHARRPGDSPMVLDFIGPPSGINRSAATNITAQPSPFSFCFSSKYSK
jgi:hypothetical protein